jgi:ubiquinone/menaquinone biosynthesis C-methylase UbiE
MTDVPLPPLRVNLASGTDIRSGWVNVDICQWPGYPPPDVYWDARTDRLPFPDGTVDEVVAGYLLLHVAPRHHDRLLNDIYRIMKPGGRLEIGEVDMRLALERWLTDPDDPSANDMIWGEQGNQRENWAHLEEYDKHRCGYDEAKLRRKLEQHGFGGFRRYKQHSEAVWYEMSVEVHKP